MEGKDIKDPKEGEGSIFAASKQMNDLAMDDEPRGPLTLRDRGRRFIDSFRPDPDLYTVKQGGENGDIEQAAVATAASPLKRKLKARHLQMIAIGGSVGKIGLWRCSS